VPITQKTTLILCAATTLMAFGAGIAVGQAQPPTATKGFSSVNLRSLDLTEEIDSIKGRPLRMRKITVQPGGVLELHTHKGRPAVSYILEGSMTYHQEGKSDTVAKAGDGIAEGRATTHWAENLGSVPAVWIAVDIPEK
jgi:quercetin dioxygenase-like cupin family protein